MPFIKPTDLNSIRFIYVSYVIYSAVVFLPMSFVFIASPISFLNYALICPLTHLVYLYTSICMYTMYKDTADWSYQSK